MQKARALSTEPCYGLPPQLSMLFVGFGLEAERVRGWLSGYDPHLRIYTVYTSQDNSTGSREDDDKAGEEQDPP